MSDEEVETTGEGSELPTDEASTTEPSAETETGGRAGREAIAEKIRQEMQSKYESEYGSQVKEAQRQAQQYQQQLQALAQRLQQKGLIDHVFRDDPAQGPPDLRQDPLGRVEWLEKTYANRLAALERELNQRKTADDASWAFGRTRDTVMNLLREKGVPEDSHQWYLDQVVQQMMGPKYRGVPMTELDRVVREVFDSNHNHMTSVERKAVENWIKTKKGELPGIPSTRGGAGSMPSGNKDEVPLDIIRDPVKRRAFAEEMLRRGMQQEEGG